jgi:hypothetical protein
MTMTTSIRNSTTLFLGLLTLCATATPHSITVYTANGKVQFRHNPAGDGEHGNVKGPIGDTVTWQCDPSSCTSFSIHFYQPAPENKVTPCSGVQDISSTGNPASATCKVSDTSLLQPFKYKITVKYGGKTFERDPHVIVDNQVFLPPPDKKRPNK